MVRSLEWIRAAVLLAAAIAWRAWPAGCRYQATVGLRSRACTRGERHSSFFALLAIVHTWPLASSPATLSRYDNSDAMLNEWALAWVAHQIVRDPLHLFDANIFFPERNTLAYSEAMLVQGVLGAPLVWLGAPTLLVYNLVLLAGFTLTGWATCLVAARWTGSWAGGAAAGIVAAFNAHTLTRLPHLQALHVEFLPLALAALDALLREPNARHALKLAIWFVLQSLASIYLLVVFGVRSRRSGGVPAARVDRQAIHPGRPPASRSPPASACWRSGRTCSRTGRCTPSRGSRARCSTSSCTPRRGRTTCRRRHACISTRGAIAGSRERRCFPAWWRWPWPRSAVVRGIAWRDPRARMCLAFGICGVLLSFGTKLPGYEWLYRTAAAAAGDPRGVAVRLSRHDGGGIPGGLRPRRPSDPAAAPSMAGGSRGDSGGADPRTAGGADLLHAVRRCLDIYETIASDPHAVVVELPMPGGFGWFGNARYMINSTRHFRPMLNGYSGFAPASFHEHIRALAAFPEPAAMAALKAFGVTHVFLHVDGYTAAQRAIIEASPELSRVASDELIVLYKVNATPAP